MLHRDAIEYTLCVPQVQRVQLPALQISWNFSSPSVDCSEQKHRLHTLSLNAVAVLTINQISHLCVSLVVLTLKFLKSFESYWDLIKFPLASVASCA